MAKVSSGELHRNENAAIQFGAAIVVAVRNVRATMPQLISSRKADEYAPGALHALRKLCEGEGQCGHIHRQEVEEWRTCFLAWFNRVKRWFPKQYADPFLAHAQDDFRVLLACANDAPESFWREKSHERDIVVTLKTQQALDDARRAAQQQHPVELGSALHKYLERCIAGLLEAPAEQRPPASPAESPAAADQLAPRITLHADRTFSLRLDDFTCFDTAENLEQDIVTTAYDVEDAVRNYLAAKYLDNKPADLHYACESSQFCVYCPHIETLAIITEALIRLAADRDLYRQHRTSP
ncbi:MAG: hypothetical protein RIC55_35845 [Pirellulaceae bacterium]